MLAAYKWKTGARIKIDPQVAGDVCDALEKEGRLTPAELVSVSRDEDAPLHGAFEWRDEIAAEKYRETQAGHIIRSLEVKLTGSSEPVRAYFPVAISGGGRQYTSTEIILQDATSRDTLLKNALAELRAFKRKYKILEELSAVFEAIEQAGEQA